MAWKRGRGPGLAVHRRIRPRRDRVRSGPDLFQSSRPVCREAAAIEHALAAGEVAGFTGGFTGASGVNGLVDDFAARGVLSKECAELFVHERLDRAAYVGIELALGLAFELGLRELDADDGDEALADVRLREISFTSLNRPICWPA